MTMIGKRVRQIGGFEELIGRTGIVAEVITDEKFNDHALVTRVGEDDFWCPVALLDVLPVNMTHKEANACLDRFYDSAFAYLQGDDAEDKRKANEAHEELKFNLGHGGYSPSWSPGIKRKFYQWNPTEGKFETPAEEKWEF
jgi:hypothetical protein